MLDDDQAYTHRPVRVARSERGLSPQRAAQLADRVARGSVLWVVLVEHRADLFADRVLGSVAVEANALDGDGHEDSRLVVLDSSEALVSSHTLKASPVLAG